MSGEATAAAETPRRMRRTPEQEYAYLTQRLARLKATQHERNRKAETREKIVIGGAIVKAMKNDPEWRQRVVALLNVDVTRPQDREAIAPWLSAI